ncbi:hypothetical protein Tel_04585 [Candidatus Tenderia electrophaga]|uniref:MotA/TolQ/ExbB proton channel domain-containing protein n=1 Tax=Candidatus Tenderia electrophaga TaxID=1748243 RepID=A0A0S2TBF1_9GAMM|nr:hypothetical protein Tel_04585 [Candidatus Tenderia electrophaga]
MANRTIIFWLLWALVALGVYFTLYSDTGIWDYIENDVSRMTWLILGMFLLGVGGSLWLATKISLEARRLRQVEAVVRERGLQGFESGYQARAVDRFFESLKTTLDTKGRPEVENLMRAELAVFERGSRSVEVAGNLLVTMGLIGTVMGLTLTLAGLTGSLDALGQDRNQLIDGLRRAMGGMSTAFYTTLLGAVFGGVLLRVFAQITQHGVEALYDNLGRICLVYCSADYKDTLERDVRALKAELQGLDDQLQALRGSFGGTTLAFSGFRDEVRSFVKGEAGREGESLQAMLEQHRAYCDMLRQEMRLVYALNRPWWVRFMSLLPGGR